MQNWANTVATAAPRMPHPRTKMNIGAKMQLSPTVPKVAYMAFIGRLVERSRALRPR